jgi:hypothetical protein
MEKFLRKLRRDRKLSVQKERKVVLKRSVMFAFCVLALCLLSCLVISARPVNAQETGYSHMCYPLSETVTIDGKWTYTTEWIDGLQTSFGTNALFIDKYQVISASDVNYFLLIETGDDTNNTKDFIEICFDGGMTADSAPSSTDFAINITGNAVCTWYQGTGTAWTKIATPDSSVFQWAESYSTSPTISTSHMIFEMFLQKTSTALGGTQIIGPEFWMLIETYDASTGGYGLQSWPTVPPSSPDVPTTYGDIPYTSSAIPESLNIGAVMVLSVVAVTAGTVILQKRSKIANLARKQNPTAKT